MHSAAEAVIELLRRADAERRGLLVVERAQADVIRARLAQLDVALHYVDDIYPIEEILLKRIGDHLKIGVQSPISVGTSAPGDSIEIGL